MNHSAIFRKNELPLLQFRFFSFLLQKKKEKYTISHHDSCKFLPFFVSLDKSDVLCAKLLVAICEIF